MAIPASQIVSISPRVLQAGGTDLVLNGCFLTENTLLPVGAMAVTFATPGDVMEYFGDETPEYNAAVAYFNGYVNSFKKPRSVIFARRISNAVAAYLRGAKFTGALSDFTAISSGSLSIAVDGTTIDLTSLDFSSVTDYSGAASVLNTAFGSAATVAFDSFTGAFIITSGTSGASSTIGYAVDGDVAALLGWQEGDGGVLSQGSAALSVSENMAAIKEVTANWATFTPVYDADDDEMVALATWANNQGVEYLCVLHSNDTDLVSQNDGASIAYLLNEAHMGATTLIYGELKHAAFICGAIASIDWERVNGTITLAFKKQNGMAANVTNATDAAILEAKNVNFIGEYATRNDDFVWLYPGRMFDTNYNFIDAFICTVWFNSAIQVAIMSGLGTAGRVPYNEDGYTLIRAWIQDPIDRALRNGVINTGMVLSNAQIAEVATEAGMDISAELQNDGYYLQILDPGAHIRTNRESPSISLWYCYAGSVQRIEMASTMII